MRRSDMTRLLAMGVAAAIAVLVAGCIATTDSATPETKEASPAVEAGSVLVEVKLGHCFVEPMVFDGKRWNVPFTKQFGWGGLQPKNWEGTGAMTRVSEERARFEDDGGSTVIFLPVDHASVRPVENALCD